MTGEEFGRLKLNLQLTDNRPNINALAKAYSEAPTNPDVFRAISEDDLTATGSGTSLLLVQTIQNQKLIEQNARIIALLKAHKKQK